MSRLKDATVERSSNCAQVRGSVLGTRDALGEGSERDGDVGLTQCSVRVGFLPPLESPVPSWSSGLLSPPNQAAALPILFVRALVR